MRSKLEERVAQQLEFKGIDYEYEPRLRKVPYTVPESNHKYTPDFIIRTKSGNEIYLEPKGIWDLADRRKHLYLRQQHPELDIRFVFQRSKTRIRKGSNTTYADVCNGLTRKPFKGVVWKYCDGLVPDEWLEE